MILPPRSGYSISARRRGRGRASIIKEEESTRRIPKLGQGIQLLAKFPTILLLGMLPERRILMKRTLLQWLPFYASHMQ